jgi:hypothetical protein
MNFNTKTCPSPILLSKTCNQFTLVVISLNVGMCCSRCAVLLVGYPPLAFRSSQIADENESLGQSLGKSVGSMAFTQRTASDSLASTVINVYPKKDPIMERTGQQPSALVQALRTEFAAAIDKENKHATNASSSLFSLKLGPTKPPQSGAHGTSPGILALGYVSSLPIYMTDVIYSWLKHVFIAAAISVGHSYFGDVGAALSPLRVTAV